MASFLRRVGRKGRKKDKQIRSSTSDAAKYEQKQMRFKKTDSYPYVVNRNWEADRPRFGKTNDKWSNENTDVKVARIACCGDLMCEPNMSEAAYFDGRYYFDYMFKHIRPILKRADFSIANLETLVSEKIPYAHEMHIVEHPYKNRYHCNAPIQYLDGLRYAGFDAFAMANNHSVDGGYIGIVDTLENVDKKGFMRTGMFVNDKEPRAMIVNVNGITLGVLSYTEHINRNLHKEYLTDIGQKTLVNMYSANKLANDIEYAKSMGAEFILAYIHFNCKEYSHQLTEHQVELAKEIANAGVDCIMGSHSHSIQQYDVIKTDDNRTVPIVYSLSNFVTSDNAMITRESIIYQMTLEKECNIVRITEESYVPCRLVEGTKKDYYSIWPTPKRWTDGKNHNILNNTEGNIVKSVGNKIRVDKNIGYKNVGKKDTPSIEHSFPIQPISSINYANILLGGFFDAHCCKTNAFEWYKEELGFVKNISGLDYAILPVINFGKDNDIQNNVIGGATGINNICELGSSISVINDIKLGVVSLSADTNIENAIDCFNRIREAEYIVTYFVSDFSDVLKEPTDELLEIVTTQGADIIVIANDECAKEPKQITGKDGKTVQILHPGCLNNSAFEWRTILYSVELIKLSDGKIRCRCFYLPEAIPNEKIQNKWGSDVRREMLREYLGNTICEKVALQAGSTQNVKPQISIAEVCGVLGIDYPNIDEDSLHKKRYVAITKSLMKLGGIAIIQWGKKKDGTGYYSLGENKDSEYISPEYAENVGASILISELDIPSSLRVLKLPSGMTARRAWVELCRYIRHKYSPGIITVTGNAGKTTTKDLIGLVLEHQYKTLYVEKNFNTWRTAGEIINNLDDSYEMYIQEVHEPHSKDCSYMLDADATVITNIGVGHLDEVGNSFSNILDATLQVLDSQRKNSMLFINNDCPQLKRNEFVDYNVIRYGINPEGCDYWADNIKYYGEYSAFTIKSRKDEPIDVVVNLPGKHNINNALSAYAVGRWKDIDPRLIVSAISRFRGRGIRQHLIKAKGCRVLVDCYSSTLLSTVNAAHTLAKMPVEKEGRRILVLGYLTKLGDGSAVVHEDAGKQISEIAKTNGISKVLCYRQDSKIIADICKEKGVDAEYFEYHKDLEKYLINYIKEGDTLVFKSGTAAHLEQVVNNVFGVKLVPENTMDKDRAENGGSY